MPYETRRDAFEVCSTYYKWMGNGWSGHLLANKEHIYRTQVEVVEKWQRSQAIISRMLASIKLSNATLACERVAERGQ